MLFLRPPYKTSLEGISRRGRAVTAKNEQKSVLHMQSCCFFDVLVAKAVPSEINSRETAGVLILFYILNAQLPSFQTLCDYTFKP